VDSRSTHVVLEQPARAPALSDATIGSLRESFDGELIRPDDAAYEAARQIWNAMWDRHPALIARPTGTADVVAAIRFARAAGMEIAVRGGGHSVAGHCTTEGGLMLDLSRMNGVRVDAEAGRAWVQGGAQLAALDHEAQFHGLATTAGMISHTGVGGLTLGGGYGYLARRRGLACDNVVSFEVVTADGEVLVASETRNADLFWALRGGGGNFGVVTTFEFQLHPLDPMVMTGDLFFGLDRGAEVLRSFAAFSASMPEEMLTSVAMGSVRPEWGIEGLQAGSPILVLSWVYTGDAEEGRRQAAALYESPKPLVEMGEAMPYVRLQRYSDEGTRFGMRRYWKGSFVSELTDEGIQAFLSRGTSAGDPEPMWSGELISMGGAIARVGEDETAFSGRNATFDFLTMASWEDPAEDEVRLAGARHYWDVMAPHTMGRAYVNSMEPDDLGRVREAYGARKFERLAALKQHYDPDNVFHLNQNIRPSADSQAGD
jgi:FAD/FMN-containing dehydrogenase